MTRYITNAEFRQQKSALTRAINSGDPEKVLTACERVLDAWEDKAWPDDWRRWLRASEDAYATWKRDNYPGSVGDEEHPILDRFATVQDRFGY